MAVRKSADFFVCTHYAAKINLLKLHVNTVFIKFWLQNKMKQKIKTTQFVTQTILQTIIMYYCSRYLGGLMTISLLPR